MLRWPIDRYWALPTSFSRAYTRAHTDQLQDIKACALLGASGLGKTFELQRLAETEASRGADVVFHRLASLGPTAESLEHNLKKLSSGLQPDTILYLDAVDEVMIPVRQTALILETWVRGELAAYLPTLRISCRSAVWPSFLGNALHEVYGDSYAEARLEPLSDKEVRRVAEHLGHDPDIFLTHIKLANASALAGQPLTLSMLLRVFSTNTSLPSRRNELFKQGIYALASDRYDRSEAGTDTTLTATQTIELGEQLACYALLSGREDYSLVETFESSVICPEELESLAASQLRISRSTLRDVARSGLFEGIGESRFRFAHRQFGEYLAARRLSRLLPHQWRSILASSLGWKAGVAGPFRELAAFAAMESKEVAQWLATYDPELLGVSDVADAELRRRALLGLLARFQSGELTDHQAHYSSFNSHGLHYEGAAQDLRESLLAHASQPPDATLFCLLLVDAWKLTELSPLLADLLLDESASIEIRVHAGQALCAVGDETQKARTKHLLYGEHDADSMELRGIALRCNWPWSLSTTELLSILSVEPSRHYSGIYAHFLIELDASEFSLEEDLITGLSWAKKWLAQQYDHGILNSIAKRIATQALKSIDRPDIAKAIGALLFETAKSYSECPFRTTRQGTPADDTDTSALLQDDRIRRTLLSSIATECHDESCLWWLLEKTPELQNNLDFPWLMERATDSSVDIAVRERYAEIARNYPWNDSPLCNEAWFLARDIEPVRSRLAMPLFIELESELANNLRLREAKIRSLNKQRERPALDPPPSDRVKRTLDLCETDPRFFYNLINEMTLEPHSQHYGHTRFIESSPGWISSDGHTRTRIVNAAKALLLCETIGTEKTDSAYYSTVSFGDITAILFIYSTEQIWLESLPVHWWEKRAWYIIRELHLNMHREPSAPKLGLLTLLHRRAPSAVHEQLLRLARHKEPDSAHLLRNTLSALELTIDSTLDKALSCLLAARNVSADRLMDVARFALRRGGDAARHLGAYFTSEGCIPAESVSAAVALLCEIPTSSWAAVNAFLLRRPDLAFQVYSEFANAAIHYSARQNILDRLLQLHPAQIGEFTARLLEALPADYDHTSRGAQSVGPLDAVRELRDRVLNWLGDQNDSESVRALVGLEMAFGKRFPWLRRTRSRAQRAMRLARPAPIPLASIADMLDSGNRRLIRTTVDAVDGVVAAIEWYAESLALGSPGDVEDLWNSPRGVEPTPKSEERISEKLLNSVRTYFHKYAVVASCEVQIFRRKRSTEQDGAPGSLVDVLCQIPSRGTADQQPITVPIEVKLAHNREASTGIWDQLVERYMQQLGTDSGVFVVIWMGRDRGLRPQWRSSEVARSALSTSVTEISERGLEQRSVQNPDHSDHLAGRSTARC